MGLLVKRETSGTAVDLTAADRTGVAGQDDGYAVVAIAASLGGIGALSRLIAGLPANFPLPILVVQHLRRGRPSLLPTVLAYRTGFPMKLAEEGERPVPGQVYLAPPNRHLLVRSDGALGLSVGDPVNFCRPSADVLFRSLAGTFGPRAIVVVLTGMGRDGARGVEAIAAAGGATIAQDEASAEAPDMPCAAVDIGRADLVLPLDRIGFALEVLARDTNAGGDAVHSPPPARSIRDRRLIRPSPRPPRVEASGARAAGSARPSPRQRASSAAPP